MANIFQSCSFRFLPIRIHIRRLIVITLCWFCVCYLVFHLNQHQGALTYFTSHIGHRELLQQENVPDYSHETNKKDSEEIFLQLKPSVDESPPPSEKDLLKILSNQSNLPLAYWSEAKSRPSSSKACSKFPSLYDLDFNNIYWQRLTANNGTFYLYGAYFDNRQRAGNVPLVRILGMIDKISPPPTYCQFWYDGMSNEPQEYFSQSTYTYIWYNKWGNYKDGILQPFLISCPVPTVEKVAKSVPASVSLVGKKCDKPTNNLHVVNQRPSYKQDFAVCVKGLDFLYEDISVRLVEWIEILNILGAKKIFLYELEIHPNISKVLAYYKKRGIVELTPITLPGNQPNLPGFRHLYLKSKLVHKRQNELIPYNDCLYKNLYTYEHLALLDIDEVIMPLKHETWKDLMWEILRAALHEKNYTRASYNFRNVYFLDDLQDGEEMTHNAHEEGIPRYLHMLQHVFRSKNFTKPGSYVKCFHNTERVVSLHNHFPLNCFGQCTTYSVQTSLAQMQHYRKDCVGPLKKTCTDYRNYTTRDTTIWRYKNQLIRRTTEVLSELGFFRDADS